MPRRFDTSAAIASGGGVFAVRSAPLRSKEAHNTMLKSATGKVMWVGRATVFLVGLSVIVG